MHPDRSRALAGISVVEITGGIAAAYCGRLLADVGASVTSVAALEGAGEAADNIESEAERLYAAYLSAGKRRIEAGSAGSLPDLCGDADIVIIGEGATLDLNGALPKIATIELTWFGKTGPYSGWKANDLIIQSLTAMPHLAGAVEGPPVHSGYRHSALIGGVTAYIAAVAGIVAPARSTPRRFTVNLFEANLVLSEMDIHFVERDGVPLKRQGVNRFSPNGPVGIYPCKDGWVAIIATTPDQWRSLCLTLGLHEQGADASLSTREMRFSRLDEVESAMVTALAHRTAEEWGALGRTHRVPIVPVPDANGILHHPIFQKRQSLASLTVDGKRYHVPRTPFGLTETPTAIQLDDDPPASAIRLPAPQEASLAAAPLEGNLAAAPQEARLAAAPLDGIVVVDFTMGWAGPLASRLLGDLGAEVLKIEAGRYPDWWRGVNWTPEYIANREYENARGFCALNRGKHGVSLDLTTAAGRDLALSLVAKADAVVENQAAGVMTKLGLGYEQIAAANPSIVMMSMSAFGSGNAWSDTRAYGSTLEQGSGLPRFTGFADAPPTMAHLAYGDPVGGLYGCAAVLTALAHKKRSGQRQYVNLSMIEAMLQFTTPALLEHQVTGADPMRRGNRSAAMAPHNIYRSAGEDRWLAIAVEDATAFDSLARIIGRNDWAGGTAFRTLEERKRAEDEIDAAIQAWTSTLPPELAAERLQAAGVCAAPVVHTEDLVRDPHLCETGFFIDLTREFSGDQRQAGTAITEQGERLRTRRPAPLLGQHSWDVLHRHLGIDRDRFDVMVQEDIVCFEPKSLRSRAAGTGTRPMPSVSD